MLRNISTFVGNGFGLTFYVGIENLPFFYRGDMKIIPFENILPRLYALALAKCVLYLSFSKVLTELETRPRTSKITLDGILRENYNHAQN